MLQVLAYCHQISRHRYLELVLSPGIGFDDAGDGSEGELVEVSPSQLYKKYTYKVHQDFLNAFYPWDTWT